MDTGLVMDADPVGASLGEGGDEVVRILDHEVAIERQFCDSTQRLHDGRAERDVGDEVAVHHIDGNGRPAAALACSHLFREPCEVCRQYRGQQFNHGASVSAGVETVQAVTAGMVMAAPRATREMARTSVLCGIAPLGSAKTAS